MKKTILSEATKVTKPNNHVICVDCSGSMYDALPKLRTELKNKISSLIKDGDKLSIIYFSGRNEADFVFDNYEIKNASQLSNVKAGIDRWLKPMGATAFAKPLSLALTRVDGDYMNNLIFMTDGYNNDCPLSEVFSELEKVAKSFESTFFIEYGNYADSKTISKMAEESGGAVLNATDFQDLTTQIYTALEALVTPKIEVDGVSGDYVIGDSNWQLIRYKVENGKALVDGSTENVYYGDVDGDSEQEALALIYMNFNLGRFAETEKILYQYGDVELIELYSKAYGKQKMASFRDAVLDMYFGRRSKFVKGKVEGYQVDENAYDVMDMLNDLSSNPNNKVFLYHPEFNYNRIGLARIKTKALGEEVKEKLLTAETVEDAKDILSGVASPKFVPNDENGAAPLNSISFNTERANVNMSVQLNGKVINIGANQWNISEYDTYITRLYNIFKDGILNLDKMPVSLDGEILKKFKGLGIIEKELEPINGTPVYLLNFSELPIINRSKVKALDSKEFVEAALQLEEQKAAQKVYKFFNQQMNQPSLTSDEKLDEFLASIGITKNGFNQPSTSAPSTDVYYAPTLQCKFAGLSSLPAINDAVKKRVEGKKLNLADRMILKYYDSCTSLLATTADDAQVIASVTKSAVQTKRNLEVKVANNVMSLILSRGWFKDLEGFEDNKVEINSPEFGVIDAKLDFKETPVKI